MFWIYCTVCTSQESTTDCRYWCKIQNATSREDRNVIQQTTMSALGTSEKLQEAFPWKTRIWEDLATRKKGSLLVVSLIFSTVRKFSNQNVLIEIWILDWRLTRKVQEYLPSKIWCWRGILENSHASTDNKTGTSNRKVEDFLTSSYHGQTSLIGDTRTYEFVPVFTNFSQVIGLLIYEVQHLFSLLNWGNRFYLNVPGLFV